MGDILAFCFGVGWPLLSCTFSSSSFASSCFRCFSSFRLSAQDQQAPTMAEITEATTQQVARSCFYSVNLLVPGKVRSTLKARIKIFSLVVINRGGWGRSVRPSPTRPSLWAETQKGERFARNAITLHTGHDSNNRGKENRDRRMPGNNDGMPPTPTRPRSPMAAYRARKDKGAAATGFQRRGC